MQDDGNRAKASLARTGAFFGSRAGFGAFPRSVIPFQVFSPPSLSPSRGTLRILHLLPGWKTNIESLAVKGKDNRREKRLRRAEVSPRWRRNESILENFENDCQKMVESAGGKERTRRYPLFGTYVSFASTIPLITIVACCSLLPAVQ